MKIIIGLGNVGAEYKSTYHNVGFMVVDECLNALNIKKNKLMCDGMVYECNVNQEKIIFVKPTTYMNNSGLCVKSIINKFDADISDCLVIVDDIDLQDGKIRIRHSGSAGTHNGLRNITQLCGSEFARVRVGIGRPQNNMDLADYVLSRLPHQSDAQIYKGINTAVSAVLDYIKGDSLDSLMQSYNK